MEEKREEEEEKGEEEEKEEDVSSFKKQFSSLIFSGRSKVGLDPIRSGLLLSAPF